MPLNPLPNGCKYSPIKVHPKNWQTLTASVKENWYVWYRFHDPLFKDQHPKGKLIKKQGMNEYKTATERRASTRAVIADIKKDLEQSGYNPITGLYQKPEEIEYEIDPSTPFLKALVKAATYIKCEHNTMLEIERTTKHFSAAAVKLRYNNLPIRDVKRSHIRFVLKHLENTADYWSGHIFNHYRRNLSMLFTQLVELEAIEYNPVKEIKKATITKKVREVMSDEQRPQLREGLSEDRYEFWRYLNIFFHSGARNTELLRLRTTDVNLKKQTAKYLVKKGRQFVEVERVIKDIALPYWEEIMKEAKPDDYLFSKGLKPGPASIRADQIKRRWRVHVKEKLGFTSGQYALKHLHSDEITAALDAAHAARINAHTSERMVNEVYAVGEKGRVDDRIRKHSNKLA